jgi:hypothetical protein
MNSPTTSPTSRRRVRSLLARQLLPALVAAVVVAGPVLPRAAAQCAM